MTKYKTVLSCIIIFLSLTSLLATCFDRCAAEEEKVFKAGAAVVDITPTKLPIVPSGNFFPRPIDEILDPLSARCLVLHDGTEQVVFLLIDCCVMPRPVVEAIKSLVVQKTGIPRDRLLVAATHTHSAPEIRVKSVKGETRHSIDNISEAVVLAQKNLAPAKIGWAVGNDPTNVFCRRFLMKPGTAMVNAFGGTKNDRAMMNPGHTNTNKIARTGPVDTTVSVLSVLSTNDQPIALLANYSTHYAGVLAHQISADYFGVFAEVIRNRIAEKIGHENMSDQFVGIMTNGTSGDANCIDFYDSSRKYDIHSVAHDIAAVVMTVWPNIEYHDWVPIGMKERELTIANRLPTDEEINIAREHIKNLPEGKAKTIPDFYAFCTVEMVNYPAHSDVIVQAIRLGELGMTALPGEFYGITGLEIKARSPFVPTINFSLANGNFGYIPPPEQHRLGGYNVWRKPGCCLVPEAEPRIKQTLLELLEELYYSRR